MGALDNMLAGKRQERTTTGALDRMIEASKQGQTGTQTAPRSVAAMRKSAEYRPLKTAEEVVRTTTEDTSRSGEKADTPTFGGRLKRMASGAGKQYASSYANLAGLGQTGTTKRMRSEAAAELDNLEREIAVQKTLLSDPNASEADRESARSMIEGMEKKADAYRRAYGTGGENEKTAAKLYETADDLAERGAQDVQEAKRGLGKVGSLAVDAGVGGMQLGADILLGLPTGGAMLPMALRSAGGASQEARQEGASHEQQTGYGMAAGAISVLTEKLSNAAKPLAKVFGKGIADDMVEQAVKSLAARLANTPAGRTAAQALLKTGVSALGEGFEEMAEDVFDVAAKRMIYDPTAELDVGEMLYDGLVGGTLGGVLGLGGEIVGARGEYEKYRLKTAEELAAQKKAAPTAESGVQTETTPKYLKTVEEMAAERNAAAEETAVTVESGPTALTERNRENNTLAYTLATNVGSLESMQPVTKLRGTELNDRTVKPDQQIRNFFRTIGGKIFRSGFGDVSLGEYGVGGALNHRPLNRAKMLSLAAVPDVIQSGRQISYTENWKERGYKSYIFAAPVVVGKDTVYVAAVVDQRPDNKFYLSEMVDSNGNYVRINESPSGSSKSGITDGAENIDGAGVTARPEGLSEGNAPSTSQNEVKPAFPFVDTTVPQDTAGVNAQDMQGDAEYAQEGPRYLKTAEEMAAERAAAEEASYRQAEQSGEGYMDALARDENLFEEPLTPSDRIYAMKLDELQTREAPPEQSRTDVERRDVDELAELYAAAENPVSTARDARFEASEGLVKAKTAEDRKTAKDRAEDARSFFMRKMVDAGDSVTRVAKATGDRYLYSYYNMARSSASAGINMIAGEQTDVTGKRVGKSLNDIFQPIRKLGDDYYNAFQLYLFDLHNADRMSLVTGENTAKLEAELALKDFDRNNPDVATLTEERLRRNASDADPDVAELAKERLRLLRRVNQADRMGNKPVFSYEVTADMSRERADRLVHEHPEFEQYRAEVRKYIDNLMQYRVDSGLMTQEDAAFLKRYYPNYVPTFRAVEKGGRGRDRRSVQIGKTVGRAEGGTQKLVPLHEALGKQTMSVVREGSKNRFGQRLLDDYMNSRTGSETRRYVRDAQEFDADFSAETFDQTDPTPRRENTFSVYKDGKKWDMTVDESMFDAVKALSPDAKESSVAVTAIRSANNLFKSLVTGYNPTFLVRNTIRDLQTAGLYSRDGKAFAQNYPLALKEIRTNGEYWKQYKALGGSFSSVFDYRTGTVKEQTGKAARLLGKLEALNMATEQAPRLAEFMSVVKAGDGSMSNLMDAMHAAADVTVNFGRAGTLGKVLNANFVPFLNPGIQGFDKMIRRVTETQGAKEWASLVVRAAVLGIAPTLINAALYSDDDEWDDIRDSDKDTNYLFKLGDGVWLKIPKGRELSLLGMTADRIGDIVNGESVDWRDFITTASNQVAPANPLKSNIFSAYADADLFDPSSPGKTWYGGDIESQRLRKYAPGERYDSSTDVVSKWIGEQLGLSPKKINYLLDQYTGVVGDFVLPLLTPQAERGMFEKAFTLDSVSNNRISGEFYDESDKLTYAKNGGDDAAAVVSRFWSKQAAACAGIYAEIRKTENSDLTNAEKKQKVREAKAVLNGIQKNALALEETYRKAAEKAVRETNDTDDAYREANRGCFGAEYVLEVYNKDVYAKAKEAHEGGIEYDTYYDYYFAAKELKADKDRNGKTITGSKREKVLKLIDSMELSDYQKDVLYLTEGYSEKTIDDAPWNQSEYEKYRLKLPKYELPEYELPKYELEVKLLPRP